MVQSFIDSERAKEKLAEQSLVTAINSMVSEWTKTRGQRLESSLKDLQTSFKDNAHSLESFQSDFSKMVDSTIKNNTNRLTDVQTAQDTILRQQDMFQDINSNISTLRQQGEFHHAQVLEELDVGQRMVSSTCDEINQAQAISRKRPLLDDCTNVSKSSKQQKSSSDL
ncbi:hypothetical protein BDA99DRAFT_275940 [Phascolomyces articulosus]|uniref:Uncharacterized protein n=1 Tax=Phascolomyces articulosus TaxID=60185 RepID=A0AAD5K7G9_9FUNG|nr:hypothetical protein BDA99DRAFT_275940 [Phascolomyces articulosus]